MNIRVDKALAIISTASKVWNSHVNGKLLFLTPCILQVLFSQVFLEAVLLKSTESAAYHVGPRSKIHTTNLECSSRCQTP